MCLEWNDFRVFVLTIARDFKGLLIMIHLKYSLFKWRRSNATVPMVFQETAKRCPNKVAIYFQDTQWTFSQLDEYSNSVANSLIKLGFLPGDEIALFMANKPEFIGIWLGLAKCGIISMFINSNNKSDTLLQSIQVVKNCKAIIFDSQMTQTIAQVYPALQESSPLRYLYLGEQDNALIPSSLPLHDLIAESSPKSPKSPHRGSFNDTLLYIYTSGTTGLPKAVVIKHYRFFMMACSTRKCFGFRKDDVFYISLPLYHISAGILGSSQALIYGNTIALRDKFSASQFWNDCNRYKCTVAMYIGEICRYLLSQPTLPTDKTHSVRCLFGNGLRPKIWDEVVARFNIKKIAEFYGSTEGNTGLANIDNKSGAIGFLPQIIRPIVRLVYPLSLIKVDEITGEVIRDPKTGLCIRCRPGETGEIIGKIVNSDPIRAFSGYVNKEETRKKVFHDVFCKGDSMFRSGDLMVMDELGYLYFTDRTGDTFRWKGENVSTTQVEAVISKVTSLSDCVVFGVEVDSCEGKAGMAVIGIGSHNNSVSINLDSTQQSNSLLNTYMTMTDLAKFVTTNLFHILSSEIPSYAIPMFIRLSQKVETTGSYKFYKKNLKRESFDPKVIDDALFFLDKSSNGYIKLDCELYERIQSGKMLI